MATEATIAVFEGELEQVVRARKGRGAAILRTARQNPLGVIGLVIILVFGFVAAFAPLVAPHDYGDFQAGLPREDPSLEHPFGTDGIGRDMFSRVVHGSRISMGVAFLSVIGGTVIGTAIGVVSGYVRGTLDNIIQRVVDTAIAFPAIVLLLVLARVMGPSFQTVVFAIAIAIIAPVARVVRGAVLSESNNQYVEAARALGASTPRILLQHIMPNMVALSIIIATTLLGTAILAEASLSFLGLGIPVPNPSWGTDVSLARNSLPYHIWWAVAPGAAISLTVLGFNLLGDSLRDILDPRLRGRL
jgi:peptide/nickel transport system permease protein